MIGIGLNSIAQVNLQWAKSIGGNSTDVTYDMAIDASGNTYQTGYFQGTVDFDPNAGVTNLVSNGDFDVFISKFDASGNLIWAKNVGTTSGEYSYGIAVDASGNVLTTGTYYATVDFDPSAGVSTLTAAGNYDSFILKLDANGNFVWAKSIGTTSTESGQGISTDANGNVYATGYFQNSVDFDPGPASSTYTSLGGDDVYVLKLDAAGAYSWAFTFGSPTSHELVNDISVDASGNVYTTGHFWATTDFDPNTAAGSVTSTGETDIFIHKIDMTGNFSWVKTFGGVYFDEAYSMCLDNSGNIYSTGYFRETVDFDPGIGVSNLTAGSGNLDVYISKLNSSGDLVWAKSLSGPAGEIGYGITVDATGNVYTTGGFDGTVDFDPNAGTSSFTSHGNDDVFVSALDMNGNYLWAKTIGGTDYDQGRGIAVNANEDVYVTGYYNGTVDFDPNSGTVELTSFGNTYDVFILKLSTNSNEIDENSVLEDLTIYPNPCAKNLIISTDEQLSSIEIYSISGELVQTESENTFSIESLPLGMYILHVKTDNGAKSVRFVKN